jgi:hypothetical protein
MLGMNLDSADFTLSQPVPTLLPRVATGACAQACARWGEAPRGSQGRQHQLLAPAKARAARSAARIPS